MPTLLEPEPPEISGVAFDSGAFSLDSFDADDFELGGASVDVKVSWIQFDTQAAVADVKVNWFQFDTLATPYSTVVTWLQFNTRAEQQQDGRSGYWREFFTQLQAQALEANKPVVEPKFEEPYRLVEQKDGSVVITFPSKKEKKINEPEIVRPPFKRVDLPERPQLPQTVLDAPTEFKLLIAHYNVIALQYQQVVNDRDEEDVELLLLVA